MASDREEIQRRRRHLHEQLRAVSGESLMRGSIVEWLRRCGRPKCACARDPDARRPEDEVKVRQASTAYGRVWEIINGLTACAMRDLRREGRERRRARRRPGR